MGMEIDATKLVLLALRKLYEADRANIYVLPYDLSFVVKARLPAYDGTFFRFVPDADPAVNLTQATLKAYGRVDAAGDVICDGATFAPDTPKGVREGAGIHDPAYLDMDAITLAWANELYDPGPNFQRDWITRLSANGSDSWTAADVRQLLDSIFGDAMRKFYARRPIYRLYYSAARFFGRLAHGRVATVVAVALCLGGCMTPPDIADFPDGPPDMQQIESGHIGGALRDVIRSSTTNRSVP